MTKTITKPEYITQTLEEWLAEGERRFGKDFENWKFVCPTCGRIASGQEFRELGAGSNDIYQNCIGRFNGKGVKGISFKPGMSNENGCDWAAYGLFGNLGKGRTVTTPEGKNIEVFDFAPEAEVQNG